MRSTGAYFICPKNVRVDNRELEIEGLKFDVSGTILSKKPVCIGGGTLVQGGKGRRVSISGGSHGRLDAARFKRTHGLEPPSGYDYEQNFEVFSERKITEGKVTIEQQVREVTAFPFSGITRGGNLRWQKPEKLERAERVKIPGLLYPTSESHSAIAYGTEFAIEGGWAVETKPDPSIWHGDWRTEFVYSTKRSAERAKAISEKHWDIPHRVLKLRGTTFIVKDGHIIRETRPSRGI